MTKIETTKESIGLMSNNDEQVETKLFLAPMAGYTDLPFRLLAREKGAEVTISEMISAKGLYYNDKKTHGLLKSVEEEVPFGVQLFGSEPEILAEATKKLSQMKKQGEAHFNFLDFNAGCPAPKIVKNGDGSALLKNLPLLYENVKAIKENTNVPVTVKTRIGFNEGENNISEIAKTIEEAGADMLTVHGRTRSQFYSGVSNWAAVNEAVNAVKIPVILSGDITDPINARMALETGVKGLMIGRAAVDNPLIFSQIRDYLKTGEYKKATETDRINAALRHLELAQEYNSTGDHMIIALRKHLAAYTKGLPGAAKARTEIFKAKKPEEIHKIFNQMLNFVR